MAEGQAGQSPKLLDQVRGLMRVRRYALRTERACCDWIRRYVKFHRMKSRADLAGGRTNKEEAELVGKGSQPRMDTDWGRGLRMAARTE